MTTLSVPLLKLRAVGSVYLWGYKPTRFPNTDLHFCLAFQLRFCSTDSSCKWSLKGPHFAVARGFSSVSLQKGFTVPKTVFPCLGLGVSEAPFFLFVIWYEGSRYIYHFLEEPDCCSSRDQEHLSFLLHQAPVSSYFYPTGLFLMLYSLQ